jgi:hypothetical protein
MLYREIIAVCSEIHTKHINTLCGQNVEFVNVRSGSTYSKHCALKGLIITVRLYTANMYNFKDTDMFAVPTAAQHKISSDVSFNYNSPPSAVTLHSLPLHFPINNTTWVRQCTSCNIPNKNRLTHRQTAPSPYNIQYSRQWRWIHTCMCLCTYLQWSIILIQTGLCPLSD